MIFPLPGVMGPMTLARPSASSPAFDPNSIAGLTAWFKADAGVTAASGSVTAWADQSPAGLVATASAGAEPTLVSGAINGRPALRFDGTSSGMVFTEQVLGHLNVFGVFAASNNGIILGGRATNHQLLRLNDALDGLWRPMLYDTFELWYGDPVATPLASWRLISARATPYAAGNGTSAWWENGVARGTSQWSDFDFRIGSIGWAASASAGYAAVDIAELLIYEGSRSDADRQAVESYLMTKYGL